MREVEGASPAPDPKLEFCRGAEIRGLPPAERGDGAASMECSDMLDRLEATEGIRLSSTSPSSDSKKTFILRSMLSCREGR